jgi:hypothetical protein
VSGVVTGQALCVPYVSRACRRAFVYYAAAERPLPYTAALIGWLGAGLVCGGFSAFCAQQLAAAGGLVGSSDAKRMRQIARLRGRIDDGIFWQLANLIPPHWKAIRFELDWVTRQGEARLRHCVAGPEGHGDGLALPEELYRASGELQDLFVKYGQSFQKTVYSLTRSGGRGLERRLSVE